MRTRLGALRELSVPGPWAQDTSLALSLCASLHSFPSDTGHRIPPGLYLNLPKLSKCARLGGLENSHITGITCICEVVYGLQGAFTYIIT